MTRKFMKGNHFPVPNLERNTSLLAIVLFAELLAIIVSLILHKDQAMEELGRVSMYFQWCFLLPTALISLLRKHILKVTFVLGGSFVALIFTGSFIAVELVSQMLFRGMASAQLDWSQFIAHLLAASIIVFMLMVGMVVAGRFNRGIQAESEARLQALQSRIRPHFLFNSLNTISELAATRPEQAEQAISSLSMLFRAGLESERRFHSLEDELNLCRRYLELESWRLEDRLSVSWNVAIAQVAKHQIPKLILQPLIENAVLHGVQANGNIYVAIDIQETKKLLSISVENSLGSSEAFHEGNGMAVNNIKERLFVLYDDQYSFRVRTESDKYSVLMSFPKTLNQALGSF